MSLTVKERLQALIDGKKIKCSSWKANGYIVHDEILGIVDENRSRGGTSSLLFEEALWTIYEEPKPEPLNITVDDVGKKVKHRDGSVSLLIGYHTKHKIYPVHVVGGKFTADGHFYGTKEVTDSDIVEILD